MRKFIAHLPVASWMLVIFLASTDLGSSQHTSRILEPFLRWLKPDIGVETIKAVQALVRKTGHVSEYAVLGVLLWRARRISGIKVGFYWKEFGTVLFCCALYAASDEFHQFFVSTRQASFIDVFIDTFGASVGLLLLKAIGHWRARPKGSGLPERRELERTT